MEYDKEKPLITRIFWKRTYLFVEYESPKEIELSIVQLKRNKKTDEDYIKEKHVLETKELESGKYRSKINITIAEGREVLHPGDWIFIIDNDIYNRPQIHEDVLFNIEDISRVFRYGQKFYAYVVTFHMRIRQLEEDDDENFEEEVSLSFFANYMKKNKRPKRRILLDAFNEAKTFKGLCHKIFFIVAKKSLNIYYIIVSHLTPKTGKRVLFMSENRLRIMDNLEAIDTRMKERGLDKKFKVSYNFRNIFEEGKRQNPFSWLKVITKIAKQDYIFVDDYVPVFSFLKMHKKTTLVQVWHAGFGFKLVGYGRFGISGSPRPYDSCHRKYTYGLIGNDHLREIYSEVWGVEKESLLATGMPRLDHFLDKDHIEKTRKWFYKEFPQLKGKKIINFATTYRGNSQLTAHYDYSKIDFDRLYKFCKKNNAAVLIGQHHFLIDPVPIPEEYKDLIYDTSSYKLNDIFYVTDVLITDYSSAFYDFLLLEKPVLFYTYDKAIYSATRGVHRPIDSVAPGKVCNNFDQLMSALEKEDYGDKKAAEFLMDKCLTNKTIASDQVIDYVLLHKEVPGICEK